MDVNYNIEKCNTRIYKPREKKQCSVKMYKDPSVRYVIKFGIAASILTFQLYKHEITVQHAIYLISKNTRIKLSNMIPKNYRWTHKIKEGELLIVRICK